MKVALSFPGCHRKAGVERIVFECAHFLASRSHDVTVLANEWEAEPSLPIKYHYVPVRPRPGYLRGASYFRSATRELGHESFDVLNTHGCVCPYGGVQWVQSVHRAWLDRSRAFRPLHSAARWKQNLNPLHPVLLGLEEKHFRQRRYRKVIATTQDVKNDLMHYYQVPADDVVIVPNGFAPAEFNPERREQRREEMRERLGLKRGDVALLFVANELERKGYRTILDAMRRLRRANLRLLVVGRPDVVHVKRLAAEAGLGPQVVACGPTQDVSAFHAAADVFVLPTQYEAFCLAILEALGSGLPVVTSRVPGAHDAIEPGVNGFLVDDPKDGAGLASALEPLLDTDFRNALSARVPDTVIKYQWPFVLERYEQVLLQNRT